MAKGSLYVLPAALAFLSGYVDTAVFVYMGGLFVAHVTGNFVLIGMALGADSSVAHGDAVGLQIVSFPVFFVAAMLAAVLSARYPWARAQTLLWLFAALTAGAAALAFATPIEPTWVCLILVVSMGLLNAVQRLDARLNPPFTVMTGNVTAVASALGNRMSGRYAKDSNAAKSMGKPLLLVVFFALGCAMGAFMQKYLGLASMALPALVLVAVLITRPLPNAQPPE